MGQTGQTWSNVGLIMSCFWCVDWGEASGADGYIIGFAVDDCFLVGGESVWSDATVFADYHVVWVCFSGFLSFSVLNCYVWLNDTQKFKGGWDVYVVD